MKLALITTLTICAVLLLGNNGHTQNDSPCAGDIATYCKDVIPGEGRVAGCLKEHRNELTPACKDHLMRSELKLKKQKRQAVMLSRNEQVSRETGSP